MLPDLRIVIIAVLSTFVLTAGAGFYVSSRLMHEPSKRADQLAAREETPVNRIALSWPEPTRQPEPQALDFAVSAKALRNPVRDVTQEATAEAQQAPKPVPVAEQSAANASAPVSPWWITQAENKQPAFRPVEIKEPESKEAAANEPPVKTASARQAAAEDAPVAKPAPVAAAAAPAAAPRSVAANPQSDIVIAVRYPPLAELPAELRTPTIPATPLPQVAAAPHQPSETPMITGSVASPPLPAEARPPASAPELAPDETRIASRPDPANAGAEQQASAPKPPAKAARKKTAPKKAAAAKAKRPAKVARRPVALTTSAPTVPAFPLFLGHGFVN